MNTKLKIFLSVVLAATGTTIFVVGCATQEQIDKLDKKVDNIQTIIREEIRLNLEATQKKLIVQLEKETFALPEKMMLSYNKTLQAEKDEAKDFWDKYSQQMAKEYRENQIAIKTHNEELQKRIVSLQNQIDVLAKERQTKAEAFLKEAKNSEKTTNEDRTRLLYLIAIENSPEKETLLKEYTIWQKNLFVCDLKDGKIDVAEARLAALPAVFDNSLPNGTLGDIKAVDNLKEELDLMKSEINKKQNFILAQQRKSIESLAESSHNIKTISEGESLVKKLSEKSFLPELGSTKENIATEINARINALYSCETEASKDLVLPSLEYKEYWNKWLENFTFRLKNNNLSNQKRLEDFVTAEDVLASIRKEQDKSTQKTLDEINALGRQLNIDFWQERVNSVVENKGNKLTTTNRNALIAELLNEAERFYDSEKNKVKNDIIKLNRVLLTESIEEIKNTKSSLINMEKCISKDDSIQLLSSINSQALQLLMHSVELEKKYPVSFTEENNKLRELMTGFNKIIGSYRDELTTKEMRKSEKQRDEYLNWVKDVMNESDRIYTECEKIGWTTWGNKEVQIKLKTAWKPLSEIHPEDLNSIHPAMCLKYNELKTKIETHYIPTDDDKKSVIYKRLSFFAKDK